VVAANELPGSHEHDIGVRCGQVCGHLSLDPAQHITFFSVPTQKDRRAAETDTFKMPE